MLLAVWLMVFAFAATTTVLWLMLAHRVTLLTILSFAGWAWLAYRSEAVEVFDAGVTYTQPLPFMVYFALFMAAINGLGLVMHRLGEFPPEEAANDDRRHDSPG